jgi:septum formation topological specificity factor MinE
MQQSEQFVETKDVVVGGARYQISRMNAAVGSWLLFKLLDSLRKIMEGVEQNGQQPMEISLEQKEQAANALVQGMLMTLDKDLFEQVQHEALKVVGQYTAIGEKETVLPVLMMNGTFAIPQLRNDIVSVVTLTSNALFFNLSPFFLGDGLKDIFQPK